MKKRPETGEQPALPTLPVEIPSSSDEPSDAQHGEAQQGEVQDVSIQLEESDHETQQAVAAIAEVHTPEGSRSATPGAEASAIAEASDSAQVTEEEPQVVPRGRKKKKSEDRHFLFTPDVEDSIVEWWRDNEFLYNSEHPQHMDKGLKWRVIDRKAKEVGCLSKYKYESLFIVNVNLNFVNFSKNITNFYYG